MQHLEIILCNLKRDNDNEYTHFFKNNIDIFFCTLIKYMCCTTSVVNGNIYF